MKEQDADIPLQYKETFDKAVNLIGDGVEMMKPIMGELEGKKVEIEIEGYCVTVVRL